MSQTSVATSLTRAFAGMLADNGPHDIIPGYNGEASAEMPFGVVVNLTTTEQKYELPDGGADILGGVIVHSHAYSKGPSDPALGTTGIKSKFTLSVLRKGRIYMTVENGCSPGDRLYTRIVAGAGGSQKGAVRTTDPGGGEVIDSRSMMVALSTAAAAGVAVVDCDFTNKP